MTRYKILNRRECQCEHNRFYIYLWLFLEACALIIFNYLAIKGHESYLLHSLKIPCSLGMSDFYSDSKDTHTHTQTE